MCDTRTPPRLALLLGAEGVDRVLVELSVVEQRYSAVLAVLDGASVVEVANRFEVGRQTVHRWLRRYEDGGLATLADRSDRPWQSPQQMPAEVEAQGPRVAPPASGMGSTPAGP